MTPKNLKKHLHKILAKLLKGPREKSSFYTGRTNITKPLNLAQKEQRERDVRCAIALAQIAYLKSKKETL